METLEQKIEHIVAPAVQALGYRVVQVRLVDSNKSSILRIMAERMDDRSMSLDDCTEISRTISTLLDVEDPIPQAYRLEVSSPGLDRPLVKLEDFVRYAPHEIKLETKLPLDGRRRFKGWLEGVNGTDIVLQVEGEKIAIPFNDVHTAKLVLSEDTIRNALTQHKRSQKN